MDWKPVRDAVILSISTASGVPIKDVLLETERESFSGKSQGRRVRLDFDALETGQEDTFGEDPATGLIVPVSITDYEIGVLVRVYSDDHRAGPQVHLDQNNSWAFGILTRLTSRLNLPEVIAITAPQNIVFVGADTVTPDPAVTLDQRAQSVGTVRLRWRYRLCETSIEAPGSDANLVDYFDRAQLQGARPRATFLRVLREFEWRYLWAGEITDIASGEIVIVGGDAALYQPTTEFARVWKTNTGTFTTERLELGQLLETEDGGQAIVLVFRGAASGATQSLIGRANGSSIGWVLEVTGPLLRLVALGTGGEGLAFVSGLLDGEWQVVVLFAGTGQLEIYSAAALGTATIFGSHLAGPTPLVAGALRSPTYDAEIAYLGETVSTDPAQLRLDIIAALGL